jgi:hypothetical protein
MNIELDKFIIDNWEAMSYQQLADASGFKRNYIKMRVYYIRLAGIELRFKHDNKGKGASPIGTVSTFSNGCVYERTATGWKYVEYRASGRRDGKRPVQRNVTKGKKQKAPKPKVTSAVRISSVKKPEAPKAIMKHIPKPGERLVKINNKTWVYRRVS